MLIITDQGALQGCYRNQVHHAFYQTGPKKENFGDDEEEGRAQLVLSWNSSADGIGKQGQGDQAQSPTLQASG